MRKYARYNELRKIPLRMLRARLDFIWRLERIYSRAMIEREKWCKKRGINTGLKMATWTSEDAEHDKLYSRWLECHTEYQTRRIDISRLEHEVSSATNGRITGSKYNGAVAEIKPTFTGFYA